MYELSRSGLSRLKRRLLLVFSGPPVLAFIPAISLATYWFGGEGALIVLAGLLPVIYLTGMELRDRVGATSGSLDTILNRSDFEEHLAHIYDAAPEQRHQAALFILAIEDIDKLADRHGHAIAESAVARISERLCSVLRDQDRLGQLGEARFAICTDPVRHLDLEMCIQLAARMQNAVEDPIPIDGVTIYTTASIGFCQRARAPGHFVTDWMDAAATALRDALQHGPAAMRAYSTQMRSARLTREELREDISLALEEGQITPWFQPQISTETGEITGFEALARWTHPTRGLITPKDFLPAAEDAGKLGRLAEVMMYHAFGALRSWDDADVHIPQIGINFTALDLSNPRLIEKIEWELDRFGLEPGRLAIEILETVVAAAPDDVVLRNVRALGQLGCRIDLDDFGTGYASIGAIRRFSVSRIKTDRSFIARADRDPEQQRLISAILTMAEQLQVETLAEGVETVGENALLAQLGCHHVQGFGIGRPMPFDQTLAWIHKHTAKLEKVPRIMDGKSG